MKEIAKTIFRAYDIRGIVDKDFDEEWVNILGKAIGTYFILKNEKSCVVGFDCRHSSSIYHDALTEGILSTGVDVISIGMVPTPVLYFAIKHLKKNAGVMITASHNPAEFNGFKIWCGAGTIHTKEIEVLYTIMKKGEFISGKGFGTLADVVPNYIEAIAERIHITRPVKVIIDGGNGAGGEICRDVLAKIGCGALDIHCKPDGNFPAHHPDPVVEENMKDLRRAVEDYRAELGIGLDGDADRIGVMDETGSLLYGDELLSIYSRDFLSRNAGAKIIGDVKCSSRLVDDIKEHGGECILSKTGHSMIKEKMQKENVLLAGEMSGHMFFAENWYGFDDAIYAAAKIVEICSQHEGTFSSMRTWGTMISTPEIQIPCADEYKFTVVEALQSILTPDFFTKTCKVSTIDGVRISFEEGWALVRASNTQPVLVVRFEAKTEDVMCYIRDSVETCILKTILEVKNRP